MPDSVGVLTTGRQDYGILRSLIHGLRADRRFELKLFAGGMHLDSRFGTPGELLSRDGIEDYTPVPFLGALGDPVAEASRAATALARALRSDRPGSLVLMGDRSETLAAAMAGAILGMPLVHIHGGEETEGAIDNAMRHAITKLSHLHFTSHPLHRDRVVQMGEDPTSVHVVGPPGLDNLYRDDLPDRDVLLASVGLPRNLERPLLLVTVHPTTLSCDDNLAEARAVATAITATGAAAIVTAPNSDEGGAEIREFWRRWAHDRPLVSVVSSLGEQRYWGALKVVDAVVGNSSSGLIEAPAARVPGVNVGDRQKGRLRHPLTIDAAAEPRAVEEAVRTALTPQCREALRVADPLYPEGRAADRMIEILADWRPVTPIRKAFHTPSIPRPNHAL